MTLANILKQKKELSHKLKSKYKLPIKNKALGKIVIKDKVLLQKLYFGLANLPIDFVLVGDFDKEGRDEQFNNIYVTKNINKTDLKAFDFVITDGSITDISKYKENAIVIIGPSKNHLSSVLKEYNPMKNEGNSYLYEKENEWSIFHAITRYLENYKITFDNKNLVKNVYEG